MTTAPGTDLGDDGRMLRQLGILEHSYRITRRPLDRIRALEVRWHRRRLRKLLTPR